MLMLRDRYKGFTVIELMVGMAVGLLVLLAVTGVYINALRVGSTTLAGSRLNQEMSAIMNIMVNDIRRAGYWGAADFTNPTSNPFTEVEQAATAADISALRIHSNGGSGTTYTDVTYDANGLVTADSVGSCITYTYDANSNGLLDSDEEFGFRWDGWPGKDAYSSSNGRQGLLLMRTSNTTTGPNGCAIGDGNWLAVNEFDYDATRVGDNRFKKGIIVTGLSFDISRSRCINASEPDGNGADTAAELDCYAVSATTGATPGDGSGNNTLESIVVDITLTAELADDAEMTATQVQSVTLRNNLIRAR